MQLMFEDSREAVISKFLCKAYGDSDSCKELEFLGGDTGLVGKVEELCMKDSLYVVLVDVVPDNNATIRAYLDLNEYCMSVNNICVIPIPCIEYFIIKALGDRSVDEVNQIFEGRHVRETELVQKILRGRYKSFEIYCKKVVDHKLLPCQKKNGRYYTQDCICNKPLRGVDCININLHEKAVNVIKKLPVFVYSGKISGNIKRVDFFRDLPVIKQNCIDLYYDIANDFKHNGYIDDIVGIK